MNQVMTRLALSAASLLVISCGNGGSVTELDALSAVFTPDQLQPPDNSVSLREGLIAADTATLEVWGKAIAVPAVRTTFTIRFNAAVVQFVDFEPGDFFEQLALPSNVEYTVPALAPGADSVAVQIVKSNTPAGSLGDGVLIRLRFRVVAVGAGALAFENPVLSGSTGGIAQNVDWSGGQLEAR